VPHFEKMLYDNALLARLYVRYFQVSGDVSMRRVAEGILDYVVREMTDSSGGFYSTQDADSEGVEGKFFVWSKHEIDELLDDQESALFCAYYNVTEGGNFEGENILNVTRDLEAVAQSEKVSVNELEESLARSREILFAVREQRIKPARDEKVLTAWNGLMLASFAEAGVVLDRGDYLEVARNNARFVLDHLRADKLLLRTYKDGQAKLNGYLEDYAFFIEGLIALFEATGEVEWLEESLNLTATMIDEFWDDEEGGFFFTGRSHEELIVRSKDFFDNATPSGNSVAAQVLLKLALLTENPDYERRAVAILRLMAASLRRYPTGFGRLLCALDFHLGSPKEIVLVGNPLAKETAALRDVIWSIYLPNKVVAPMARAGDRLAEVSPLARDRAELEGKPTAYVCEHFTCKNPTSNPKELKLQLDSSSAAARPA
jgi:uncharacterized protein YyaL (SSP411 family)